MRNKKKLIKSTKKNIPFKDTCKKKILPIKPFHKTFPYAISWAVKCNDSSRSKLVDMHYAYFSYEDQRDNYVKKYLKGIKGIKKFKTKLREKND